MEGRDGAHHERQHAENLLGQVQLGEGLGGADHDEPQVADGPARGPHCLQVGQQRQRRNGHVMDLIVVCDVNMGDVTVDC